MEERFKDWKKPEVEHGKLTRWNWVVQHPENLMLGRFVDIGSFSYINAKYGVEIQDYAQLGSHCSIYSVSTIDNKKGRVLIKENARIGTHSTVMPGVTIGKNAVVGAHSFVNKDVPDNSIAYGTPIKVKASKTDVLDAQADYYIPLSKPDIAEEDIAAVESVLRSGRLSLGPKLNEFEQKFAEAIGTRYAVGVNSGTSGLHLCMRALGIQEGDEVITTPFSFVASANCILYEKAKPVFVDVEKETWNMNPDLIEAAITSKTKAILAVHIFGQSCNMKKVMDIAKKHNLKVIEDACESINATHYGKKVGTFGDAAVFAFYPNKQMTTGEGGMIVTNDEAIYRYCKSAANQGRSSNEQWLIHDKLGYNYRMDEMSAALGIKQLEKIDSIVRKRQAISEKYIEKLSKTKECGAGTVILPHRGEENVSSWFVFPIRVTARIRDKLILKLEEKGVQTKAYFCPCIHLQPFYKNDFGYKEGDFPTAEELSRTTMILPLFTQLTPLEVDGVVEALQESMHEIMGMESV